VQIPMVSDRPPASVGGLSLAVLGVPFVPFRAQATFASAGAVGDEALIPAVRNGYRPWAILHRHPLGTEVGEHSVNPCLVTGVRDLVSGREPPVQRAILLVVIRFTGSVKRRYGEVGQGAHES